jgi:hypothetical protein
MTRLEILEALKSCHYKDTTLRCALAGSSTTLIERHEPPQPKKVGRNILNYRWVEGAVPPAPANRGRKKQVLEKPVASPTHTELCADSIDRLLHGRRMKSWPSKYG